MFILKSNNKQIRNIGGEVVNHLATSKEEILAASRELIKENGWAAVSISSVVFTGFKMRQPEKQEKIGYLQTGT